MKAYQYLILLLLLSCTDRQDKANLQGNVTKDSVNTSNIDTDTQVEILETFIDSTTIGKKGKNKIEIVTFSALEDKYVVIKFFAKNNNGWYEMNNYLQEYGSLMGLQPNISDFNSDGHSDITFVSGFAARGANEIRRLFIYDEERGELVFVHNSEEYPNLTYNDELNCISAWAVFGGSSTHFLHAEGDSLYEFASVHSMGNTRQVFEKNKAGKEILIQEDSIDESELFIFYDNYKPLKEHSD